ncbi:ABC-three component system middle component 6 [Exiguobacterium sp. s196]|uniref:ABC-three component system middle component 6 n=1 Tax=unclassified Exiguobacterium TaxID=2644629 RepID=UPI0033377059
MILPQKHIRLSESIFGLSSVILGLIDEPISFDELWNEFQKINNTDDLPIHHDLDNFILGLTFLFIIGAIEEGVRGKVQICD